MLDEMKGFEMYEECITPEQKRFDEAEMDHLRRFGVFPVLLGMNWHLGREYDTAMIQRAIMEGKPYNEWEMLGQEFQETWGTHLAVRF